MHRRKNCRASQIFMAGRHPAPEVIVVHCGKIIVDQRVGMHHFDRSRDRQNQFEIAVEDREASPHNAG